MRRIREAVVAVGVITGAFAACSTAKQRPGPQGPVAHFAPVSARSGHGMHHSKSASRALASAGEPLCKYGLTPEETAEERAKLKDVIYAAVGDTEHRYHHALWHAARGGLEPQESKLLIDTFGSSWSKGQVHRVCPMPGADAEAKDYNPVGEDFLYMHHAMIEHVQRALTDANLPCIQGWAEVPDPAKWPLPEKSKLEGAKSEETYRQLQAWDARFRDKKWLAHVSLSQLGWALEFSVHNNLHMRYASDNPPDGFPEAAELGGAPIPFDGKFPAVWDYDKGSYDWLADPYGAAVNPIFWKIHGYVDGILLEWLGVHGYQTIADDCSGLSDCYQWHGWWTGKVHVKRAVAKAASRSAGGDAKMPEPSKAVKDFTRKRMALQHKGVIEGPTPRTAVKSPGQDAGDPNDPLAFVNRNVCPANSN